MRRPEICLAALALIVGAGSAAAQQPLPRPCAALRQVCLQAGFIPQGARAGEGLFIDCIRPIMQGIPQPPRASKPLPAVDPQLVEACRAQNPNFGMPNPAAQQQRMQRQPPAGMQAPPQMAPSPQMSAPPQNPPTDEPPQAPPAAPAPR